MAVQGSWSSATCGNIASRATISADAVRFGTSAMLPLRYEPDRDPAGNPGLIIDREGVVSQFIYVEKERALYFYPHGLGVPGTAQRFHRCALPPA